MLIFYIFNYKKYIKKNNIIQTSKNTNIVNYSEKNINNNTCIKWIYNNINI
jgi:hypothetical protein